MKSKNGFTLIEILAVIVILGIIAIILVPITLGIIDRSKQKMYDNQIMEMKNAAVMYVADNSTSDPDLKEVGVSHIVNLQTLSDMGYIDLPIKNSLTGKNFDPLCFSIEIIRQSNDTFDYNISASGSCDPVITLNGSSPDTVACASSGNYVDLGAAITDQFNPSASDIVSTSTLALKNAGTHSLLYTYTNMVNLTTNVYRSVIITNSYTPTLTVVGNPTTISVGQGQSFTPPASSATDPCEGSIIVNVASTVITTLPGNYTITYTATNKGGHAATKVVNVVVHATPTITLVGDEVVTLTCAASGNYSDPGATVVDTYNPSAPAVYAATRGLQVAGSYDLNYTYTNAISMTATTSRSLIISNNNIPTISITGNVTTMTVLTGQTFTAPTATATDPCQGALTVNVNSTVIPGTQGTYTVTYTATNAGNVTGTKVIIVTVYQSETTITTGTSTFEIPVTGNYKIEAWGGSATTGEKGGYVYGTGLFEINTEFYVNLNMAGGLPGPDRGEGGTGGGAARVSTISDTFANAIIIAGGAGAGGATGYTSGAGGVGGAGGSSLYVKTSGVTIKNISPDSNGTTAASYTGSYTKLGNSYLYGGAGGGGGAGYIGGTGGGGGRCVSTCSSSLVGSEISGMTTPGGAGGTITEANIGTVGSGGTGTSGYWRIMTGGGGGAGGVSLVDSTKLPTYGYTGGTYTGTPKVKITLLSVVENIPAYDIYTFTTNSTFTIPSTGTYKIEAWGGASSTGQLGGEIEGMGTFNSGTNLYVNFSMAVGSPGPNRGEGGTGGPAARVSITSDTFANAILIAGGAGASGASGYTSGASGIGGKGGASAYIKTSGATIKNISTDSNGTAAASFTGSYTKLGASYLYGGAGGGGGAGYIGGTGGGGGRCVSTCSSSLVGSEISGMTTPGGTGGIITEANIGTVGSGGTGTSGYWRIMTGGGGGAGGVSFIDSTIFTMSYNYFGGVNPGTPYVKIIKISS